MGGSDGRGRGTGGPPREDEILTESVLEATRNLDRFSVEEILAAVHREDRRAVDAVGTVLPEIARAVNVLVLVLQGGGRWFNVGAGTSGRMGLLDAAELPPTFGVPPDRVQGILAGGSGALVQAVEGAEDDAEAARDALRQRGLLPGDAVVAISASGRTPFALGALDEARNEGARCIAVTCDPDSPLAKAAEVAIAPVVGPEVIAGSTRMKGGLSQKMVMHLLSTAVMVRLGRVEGNQMTNLRLASSKLVRRAVRIVMQLAEVDEDEAERLLRASRGSVARAVAEARRRA